MNATWGRWGITPTAAPSLLDPSLISPHAGAGSGTTTPLTPLPVHPGYPMPILPAPPGSPAAPTYTPESIGTHWSESLASQGVAPPAPLDTMRRDMAMQRMAQPQEQGWNPWVVGLGLVLLVGGIGTGIWWWNSRRGSGGAAPAPRRFGRR